MSDMAWLAECDPLAERMRRCLAEAGYPDADVYVEDDGVHVDGVPADVTEHAFELANR